MRKSIFAAFCLLLSVYAGCGPQAKTKTEPGDDAQPSKTAGEQTAETAEQKPPREPPIHVEPKTYEEVLDAIYDFASADPKDRCPAICVNVNRTGLKEIMHGDTPKKRLSRIGYCIEDVSGDGIPELMIGEIDNKSENKSTRIISLYTTVDGEARLARGYRLSINGWYRNRYYLLGNGLLYNEGSGGAANISRSVYRLSEDGASVKRLERRFRRSRLKLKRFARKAGREALPKLEAIIESMMKTGIAPWRSWTNRKPDGSADACGRSTRAEQLKSI